MRTKTKQTARTKGILRRCLLVALLGAMALAVTSAQSFNIQPSGGQSPKVETAVIAGGGGRAAAGDVLLVGTIGQPIVGTVTAGDVQLDAGFWPVAGAAGPVADFIFVDGFERGTVESWEVP